jgi:aminoglycoside phosphotransferase (APT) family kinase protein
MRAGWIPTLPGVRWPAAEIEVDESLVRALLAEQHPDLAGLSLEETGAGWDNVLWRLGGSLVVRLPRAASAAALTKHEQRWLPEPAPRLPLPIPAPVRVGEPTDRFPWSWSVVPWLVGGPGDRGPRSPSRRMPADAWGGSCGPCTRPLRPTHRRTRGGGWRWPSGGGRSRNG